MSSGPIVALNKKTGRWGSPDPDTQRKLDKLQMVPGTTALWTTLGAAAVLNALREAEKQTK